VADIVFEGGWFACHVGLSIAARVRNHGQLAYRGVPRGWMGTDRGATASPGNPWSRRQPPPPGPCRAAARGTSAPPRRAPAWRRPSRRRSFDGDKPLGSRRGSKEPRHAVDRGLHDRGERRDRGRILNRRDSRPSAGSLRSPERAGPHRAAGVGSGTASPTNRTPVALEAFLTSGARPTGSVSPDLSLAVVKLIGKGAAYALDRPGRTSRALRPGR